jgi:hypothetical protein
MPRGPKAERRPADVIGNAVKVMRILTGDEVEILAEDDGKDPAAKALGRKGGAARAKSMSPKRRSEIARKAAHERWKSQHYTTTPSNQAFDQSLRDRNPTWGLRNLEAVTATAQSLGFSLPIITEMPANNLSVVFHRI